MGVYPTAVRCRGQNPAHVLNVCSSVVFSGSRGAAKGSVELHRYALYHAQRRQRELCYARRWDKGATLMD